MKKLEESLEWNKRDRQRSKKIWGDKKEVPLEVEPQEGGTVMEHTNIFLSSFIYFF